MKTFLQLAGLSIAFLLRAVAQTPTVVVATPVSCATSTDGSVVGILNPLNPPTTTVTGGFGGTLPAGNYFIQIAWYDAASHVTLVSSEVQRQLTATGLLTVILPASGKPSTAVGMNVYIGSTSGTETLQGNTTGAASFVQSTPLITGAAKPTVNNTVCSVVANDSGWPSGTGYKVGMTTPAGGTMPGYPMQWQLLGPGTTINLGNGFPLYNGTVTYPIPILSRPFNHAAQSISGPLYMTNYNIVQIGQLGVGTQTPGFPVDVETGAVNASGGFIVNGGVGVTPGQCLAANTDSFHTFNITIPCAAVTPPTLFYQTVQLNTTPQTQRSALNFSSNFTAADSSSPSRTTVDLIAVGTPGTYTSPSSITFDAFGRESAITASSAVNTSCSGTSIPWGCFRIEADGTVTEWGIVQATATGNDQEAVSITFPHAFANTNNLEFDASPENCVDSCGGTSPKNPTTLSGTGTLSTTGNTLVLTGVVPTGGGGSVVNQTVNIHWHATKAP